MIRTIVQHGGQAHYRISCQRPLQNTFPQALFHRREEALGNRAAHHALAEFQAVAVAGGEFDPHIAELAVAAGLLLMAALYLHHLTNGFPVGNLGRFQGDLHAELRLQLGNGHIQVLLTQAAHDQLMGFGIVGELQGGIFFRKTQHALGHLILFSLVLGNDGHGKGRGGIFHTLQHHLPGGRAQGIAGIHGGKLGHRADIAGADIFDVLLLFAYHHHGFSHPLRIAGTHIDQGSLGGDLAGNDLQIGKLADKRIGHGFEHQRHGGPVLIDGKLYRVAVHVQSDLRRLFLRGGSQPGNAVHKLLHAPHEHGVAAEHRGDGAGLYALADAYNDLLRRKFLTGKVFFKQGVVRFGNSLVDGGAQALQPVSHIGHGHRHGLATGIIIGLVLQKIDVDVRLSVLNKGNHHRADRGAELGLQIFKNTVEPGAFIAQAVDKENFRKPALLRGLKGLFRSHRDAVLTGNDHQHGVRRPHGFAQAALKIEQPGRVQQIDLLIFPLQRSYRRGNGSLPANFLWVVIAYGISFAYLAPAVRSPREIQHRLRQGGFARAAVPCHRKIDDIFRLILVHMYSPSTAIPLHSMPRSAGFSLFCTIQLLGYR